jgi:hypothetical protein
MTDGQAIEQTVVPTEPGAFDPHSVTVLEGSDDSVAPSPELVALGAAGTVPNVTATPQGTGIAYEAQLTDPVGQSDHA